MTVSRISIAALLTGAMVLGACTDTGSILAQPGDPNQRTKNGALIGAASGALLGALVEDDGDRADGALVGAVVGGAIGAGIGYSLDQQEAELRQQLGGEISIVNTGDRLIVSLPNNLLFATDSTAVSPTLQGDLRALAQNVQIYANSTLQVIGHTDSDGDAAYNQNLSEGRAQSVANVLITNGVPASRIRTFGRGESQPVASNLTPEGKAQNRRVEIVILPNAA
ncbi:MAG: OmpA family protein [Pseudomonadota bacterium]